MASDVLLLSHTVSVSQGASSRIDFSLGVAPTVVGFPDWAVVRVSVVVCLVAGSCHTVSENNTL